MTILKQAKESRTCDTTATTNTIGGIGMDGYIVWPIQNMTIPNQFPLTGITVHL